MEYLIILFLDTFSGKDINAKKHMYAGVRIRFCFNRSDKSSGMKERDDDKMGIVLQLFNLPIEIQAS
jgi:hypothetical protein